MNGELVRVIQLALAITDLDGDLCAGREISFPASGKRPVFVSSADETTSAMNLAYQTYDVPACWPKSSRGVALGLPPGRSET